jgi:hypothetical protein
MLLLRCMSPLVALSGLSETSERLSAFGAKRTYPAVSSRSCPTRMTRSGHERARNLAAQRSQWQRAAEDDVGVFSKALELALFYAAKLDVSKVPAK